MRIKTAILACVSMIAFAVAAFTTATVPSDGVYRFTFGVSETRDGSIPVPADAVCDVNGTMAEGRFSYGFLGTTDESYRNDVPSNLPSVPHAIDGFKVVKGQKIVLHDAADANGVPCVTGPAAREYLPGGASSFEGRYPVRFSMRAEERAYYAVTCTVANASSSANADVTLFSERCHTHAQHLVLAPGETRTFAWSVELAPNVFKSSGTYTDNAVNIVVVGESAALASVTVVKQPTTTVNAKIRGAAVERINVGTTMWLCDDSTGTDQRCDTPYFTLQNYAGVGSGLSRWASAGLAIRNQGEGGLASSDNVHFNSCLLKPGDYLYVEYGHNETDPAAFTNNLEKYFATATSSEAKLIVVSPLERHYSWDSENSRWNRTLQGYAEAGEAWVEAKIAAGATNVAFIDLNRPFTDWMNAELVRIHGINPSVPLRNAIDYYFFSAKGGKVDATHPNPAGADWGAYFVWSNALERVAAGEAAGATASQRVQAAVLKGVTEGVAASVANDIPWSVTDEIISAGKAPNSYWDATVRAGYDYINSAAVAAVDATCENGVATISGVSMRVLNRVNYAKAVIDIVSAGGATTNRWYSYYNYDASGNISGDIVLPEEAGFIDADLDKDATPDGHFSATLAVPAGGRAYIHFAEASGNTWQVGDDTALSAIYPFEAWRSVLLDDDCSTTDTWTKLFGGANTFEAQDDGISFSATGYDSGGTTKKNGGFARAFAGSAAVSEGRIRVSFKAGYTQGTLVFALSSTKGTTSWPLESGDVIATINGSASVFGSAVNVTLSDDAAPVAQSVVNSGEWMDVDMIIDIDAGKVSASVGGGDYETHTLGTLAKTPWKYFGVTLASQTAHAGAIDDVKIVTLAPADCGDIDTHNFVWNPDVAEGDWNDKANWLYEGVVPADAYPSDVSQDVVVFDSAATVSLRQDAAASNVTFNADVTLRAGQLSLVAVNGECRVTLDGTTVQNVSGSSLSVSNDLVISGNGATFKAVSGTVSLAGDISGSGPMTFSLNDSSSSRFRLYGNNNGYTGDARVTGGYKYARRSVFCWQNENAAGTNAFWNVEYNAASYNKDEYRMVRGTTRFGGYRGEISDTQNGTKLIVGYLNRDSYMYLIDINSGREFDIVKVGTANLEFGTALVRNLDLQAGSVTPVIGTEFNTLTLAADTTIRVAGDASWTAGTVTNLFSYTTLSGATGATLPRRVEVTGLGKGLKAEISVSDGTVTATIARAGLTVLFM